VERFCVRHWTIPVAAQTSWVSENGRASLRNGLVGSHRVVSASRDEGDSAGTSSTR
jgi:hypothetical protein